MAITDEELLEEIQYTMLEPPDGGFTWPSGMWYRVEIFDYVHQRQNRFIKETHLQLGIDDVPFTALNGRAALPFDWIATVRAVWIGSDGTRKVLMRGDSWQADYGYPTWSLTSGVPKIYMDAETPTLTLQVAPIPTVSGTVHLYFIPLYPPLDLGGDVMALPDEFVWCVKYGVMADMFRKIGLNQDPTRADYCESRYQMGVEVAKILLEGWA